MFILYMSNSMSILAAYNIKLMRRDNLPSHHFATVFPAKYSGIMVGYEAMRL